MPPIHHNIRTGGDYVAVRKSGALVIFGENLPKDYLPEMRRLFRELKNKKLVDASVYEKHEIQGTKS